MMMMKNAGHLACPSAVLSCSESSATSGSNQRQPGSDQGKVAHALLSANTGTTLQKPVGRRRSAIQRLPDQTGTWHLYQTVVIYVSRDCTHLGLGLLVDSNLGYRVASLNLR